MPHLRIQQGWDFIIAKSIFAGTVEKTGYKRQNPDKNLYFVAVVDYLLISTETPYSHWKVGVN